MLGNANLDEVATTDSHEFDADPHRPRKDVFLEHRRELSPPA
jgi:hypothetical protein